MNNRIIKYTIFTILTLIFGLVYEYFSFGVISYFMLGAFLIPLILGIIGSLIYKKLNYIYDLGVITLVIGSILKGILDIYGTSNYLIKYYLIIGIALLIIGIIISIFDKKEDNTIDVFMEY